MGNLISFMKDALEKNCPSGHILFLLYYATTPVTPYLQE